ncbi:MAG: hypothetical protein V2J24_23675 [Pseudomonadales bacterium]|nr:hypothetical protein [Pseudomonadales bacterium]
MAEPSIEQLQALGRRYAQDGRVEDAKRIAGIIRARQAGAAPEAAPAPSRAARPSGSIADPIAQGAFLGFPDEIAGLLGGAAEGVKAAASFENPISAAREGYTGTRDAARRRLAGYRESNPKTALAAEIGGGLLTGGVGAGRATAGVTGRELLKRGAAFGAGTGAVAGAGTSEADSVGGLLADSAKGAAVGMATGAALPATGQALGRARNVANRMVSGDRYKRAVQQLDDAGVTMSVGQRSGNKAAQATETNLSQMLVVGGPFQRTLERQRLQVQRKLWDMIGVPRAKIRDDGLLTDSNLRAAARSLGREYEEALGNKAVRLDDDQFLMRLGEIKDRARESGDASLIDIANNAIADLMEAATEQAGKSGRWYQQRRSMYSRLSRTNRPASSVYEDLKDAMDELFMRSAGDAKGNLDSRFAQFKQLERLYYRGAGGGDRIEGFIPLQSLANLSRRSPGSREWRRFTDAAAIVLPDRMPNSGTAPRLANMDMIQGGGIGMGLMADPVTTVGTLGLARAASEAAARGKFPTSANELVPRGVALQRLGPGASAPAAGLLAGDR